MLNNNYNNSFCKKAGKIYAKKRLESRKENFEVSDNRLKGKNDSMIQWFIEQIQRAVAFPLFVKKNGFNIVDIHSANPMVSIGRSMNILRLVGSNWEISNKTAKLINTAARRTSGFQLYVNGIGSRGISRDLSCSIKSTEGFIAGTRKSSRWSESINVV